MSINIQQGQSKIAALNLTDAKGVPHALPAGVVPAWTVEPADALSLSPASDGLTCRITGGATDGDFVLTAVTTYEDGDEVVVNLAGKIVDVEDTQGTITLSDAPVEAPAPAA